MRVLLILVLTFAAAAAAPSNGQRIIGGSVVDISEYPTIAALLYSGSGILYGQSCGGTVINARNILTAAHCLVDDAAWQWRTRVGSSWSNSGGVVLNTNRIRLHPQFNQGATNNNDVAIIQTTSNIVFNNNVRAGSIAGPNYNVADNQVLWAAGWGHTTQGGVSSPQLRHVQVWAINQAICRQRYATVGDVVNDNMLCSGWLDVGGRDQCQGDSGGPLYHNGVVVGVCSWGRGCAQAFYPGVNGRVSRYTSWIQDNVPLN